MPKRPLAPRFINQIDDYLLRNRPDTWTTRIHLMAYYWLIFSLGLSLLCFVIPDNPLKDSSVGYWIAAQVVLVVVAIVVWMVYLFRFNTFKTFGTVYPGDRIKTYFFYFLSLVLMCSTVFIPPVIETYKTMIRYSTEQVVEDMNNMNVLLARILKEDIQAEITCDTIIVVDYGSTYVPPVSSSQYTYDDSLGAYVKAPIYLSREELKWTLTEEDSVVWLNNNKLLRFNTTNFQFINDFTIKEHADTKTLRNFDIYNLVYKNKFPEEKAKLEREYNAIADKYRTGNPEDDNYYWNYSVDPTSSLTSQYGIWEINHSLDNVGDRLYRWEDEGLAMSIRVALYVSMFLSLCVFVFRHSTIKTFFLSILAAILIAIISGIIMALLDFREEGILGALIVYFLFFLIFALCTVQQKVRSVFSGIALNLAVIMTPFFLLICVACYHETTDSSLFYYEVDHMLVENNRTAYMLHLQLAEIFGFIILLIMIETVYKWMYRKWYAAPVE